MAGADDYAAWIVANQSKKGTPEFETVAEAYRLAKGEKAGAEPYAFDNPLVPSLMNIGQGMSFGFGDEIAGKIGDIAGHPDTKERYRATLDKFKNENPMGAAVGNVAGAMVVPGATIKAFAKAPLAASMTLGGAGAALQGAGDAKDAESMIPDASAGLLGGMALGPAFLGMMKGGGSVLSALGSKLPFIGDDIAQSLARRHVARSFERDGTTAEEVGKKMVGMGGEARIADAAGENTRSVLNLNAYLPGKTANNLEELIRARVASRPDRMDEVVYSVGGGVRSKSLEEALTAQQRGVATPLYAKAHAKDITPSASLIRDLEAARKLGAFGEAEKRALANPDLGPFTLGASQQALGGGKVGVRDLDYIKRGLDTLIDKETDEVTGKVTGYGRDLTKLKRRILDEVDAAVPEFKSARQAFAGPEAMKTAVTKGKAFWNNDAAKLGDMLEDMTDSEKQAFRIGAAEALRTKIGSQSGQNQLLNVWKDRNTKEKLKALLGDDVKYAEVEKFLAGEATLKRLESLGPSRNSRTAQVEAANENQTAENLADALSLGVDISRGGVVGPVTKAAKAFGRLGTPEPVRDGIGKILMQQYAPAELKALIETQETLRRLNAGTSAASGIAGVQAGQTAKDIFK